MTELSSQRPLDLQTPAWRGRRLSRRRCLEATVRVVKPTLAVGVAINASEGGLRVAVDGPLQEGEICILVVCEPGTPQQLVRARVVWSLVFEDGSIAGLQRMGLH